MLTKKLLLIILMYLVTANAVAVIATVVRSFYRKQGTELLVSENSNPSPQSAPSQTRATLTRYADGLIGVNATNYGLLKFANINVNFSHDPLKNEIVPSTVTSYAVSGVMTGEWIQVRVTNVFTNGSDMFFTINAVLKNKIAGTFFQTNRAYIFNVVYNRNSNMVYFDN